MSQCACKYSVIKHHYYFPTVNVYAMLHQCHFNYEYHTCAIVASIPILPLSLLILLQIPLPFAILMLMLLLKILIFLIDQSSEHLRGNFLWESPVCSTALIWDKGVSTNAVTFWWCLWAFYAEGNLKILKKHVKVKSNWNKAPFFLLRCWVTN